MTKHKYNVGYAFRSSENSRVYKVTGYVPVHHVIEQVVDQPYYRIVSKHNAGSEHSVSEDFIDAGIAVDFESGVGDNEIRVRDLKIDSLFRVKNGGSVWSVIRLEKLPTDINHIKNRVSIIAETVDGNEEITHTFTKYPNEILNKVEANE